LAGRVKGLGGNPDEIPPSVTGAPHKKEHPCERVREYTGKVTEVLYDCFGDIEGFAMSDCCEESIFKTREREVGQIALRACRERLVLTVYVEDEKERRIKRIAVRC
jgi:hypothetical protein